MFCHILDSILESSMDSDKCIVLCRQNHSIVQNSFIALKKFPLLCPFNSLFLQNSWQPLIIYCLYTFAFSRMRYNWSHIVCSTFRLASFTLKYAFKIHFCGSLAHFSLLLTSVTVYGWTTVKFIFLLMDI